MRFFGYTLGDESVPMAPPTPELMENMGTFMEEATGAGVIVATGGIAPTAMGAKITLKDGEMTVVDGPFTEAKELIGGWCLMRVPLGQQGQQHVGISDAVHATCARRLAELPANRGA